MKKWQWQGILELGNSTKSGCVAECIWVKWSELEMVAGDEIELIKANINDAEEIYEMQIRAFSELLERYRDYETNPGAEKIERILVRIRQSFTDYFIIKLKNVSVGAIRIVKLEDGNTCRISPIFVLKEFQNRGIAQAVIRKVESMYNPKNGWVLDTILEEKGNCHLYEKMGYKSTGKIERINERMNIVYYTKKY